MPVNENINQLLINVGGYTISLHQTIIIWLCVLIFVGAILIFAGKQFKNADPSKPPTKTMVVFEQLYDLRDFEDAILLGCIKRTDIPKEIEDVLGNKNSSIVGTLLDDIMENSIGKGKICLSTTCFKALKDMQKWNHKNIYNSANWKDTVCLEPKFYKLFDVYLQKLNKLDFNNLKFDYGNMSNSEKMFYHFIETKPKKYLDETNKKRIVIDYMAGFTDRFFEKEYNIYK